MVFTIPLAWIMIDLAWPYFMRAYDSGEMSQNAGGLIRWPVIALIPIGFGVLMMQSVSELIKRIGFLTGHRDQPFSVEHDKTNEEILAEEMAAEAEAQAARDGCRAQQPERTDMIELIANNFVPVMFAGLFFFLLTGIPVAFGLAATGLFFGLIGMEAGLFSTNLFQALPLRVFAIMSNETLLAIPFFTFMGIILERSRMAEDLLETVGQVFGPVRGGLAIAVILVGALLAATTGVVAAAVISMGLISLPIMLRYGYNRTVATGVITASGTLAQAIPPSLVLIVLADQMGRSVGDMYAGAVLPALLLVGLYIAYVAGGCRRQAEMGAGPAGRGAHLPREQRRQRPCVAGGAVRGLRPGRLVLVDHPQRS